MSLTNMTDINREFDERFPAFKGRAFTEDTARVIKAFYEEKLAVAREEGRKEAVDYIKRSGIFRAMKGDSSVFTSETELKEVLQNASLIRP